MSSLLLPLLREVSISRQNTGARALRSGAITVNVTYQSAREIKALVKNGEGRSYGVFLSQSGAFCSCPDSFFHTGIICKHAVAVALYCLQPHTVPSSHFLWTDGTLLCGAVPTAHVWTYPAWTHMLEWLEACQDCVSIYQSGYNQYKALMAPAA